MTGSVRRLLQPAVAGLLLVGLAACGFNTASGTSPHHQHHHHHGGPPSTGKPKTGGGGQTSKGKGQGTNSGDSYPPPPNVGSYQDLELTVLGDKLLGTERFGGSTLDVYQLKLQVYNSTPAIIVLALNDFSTEPASGTTNYSWNDYARSSLTQSTSLFWPVTTASTPASVTTTIDAGTRVTGMVNVAVPTASSYAIVWGAPNSGDVAATFSPPT